MEMYGLNTLETSKMDVCGFGGQQPSDITSYMYLPTPLNSKASDVTSSSNLIPALSDNYLPQVYDPTRATDILTAVIKEIQHIDKMSTESKSEKNEYRNYCFKREIGSANGNRRG